MNVKTLVASPYRISEEYFFVRDGIGKRFKKISERSQTASVLERYYNDIYKLLLAKLVDFDRVSVVTTLDSVQLESIVQELIKVKSLLTTEDHLV